MGMFIQNCSLGKTSTRKKVSCMGQFSQLAATNVGFTLTLIDLMIKVLLNEETAISQGAQHTLLSNG